MVVNHSIEPCLEDLQLVETGSIPRVETALLRDVLARRPERGQDFAVLNAYKHRLNAIRSENCTLRQRVQDLETQLAQMRATRGWKLLEKFRSWRRTVSGWLLPFSKADTSGPRP
jgi:hypothetical protein